MHVSDTSGFLVSGAQPSEAIAIQIKPLKKLGFTFSVASKVLAWSLLASTATGVSLLAFRYA